MRGTRLTVEMLRERVRRDGFDRVREAYGLSEDELLAVMTASRRALRRIRLAARRPSL